MFDKDDRITFKIIKRIMRGNKNGQKGLTDN